MNEYLISFFISLGAGLVTPLFQQNTDKSIEKKLDSYFHDALWDWTSANVDRGTHYKIKDYRDLFKYVSKEGQPQDPEIEELIVLWQNKLMADSKMSAFLTNLKLDLANKKLDRVNTLLTSANGKVDDIDTKMDIIRGKIESLTTGESNVGIDVEEISRVTFQKEKDLEHLQTLMEAFSYDLLANFCQESPNYIDCNVVYCYDVWEIALSSPLYRFYDKELDNVVRKFFNSWSEVIKLGQMHYYSNDDCDKFKYGGLIGNSFRSSEDEKIFNLLFKMRQTLNPHLIEMITYIRDNYELDIEALVMKFFQS